MAEEGFSRLRRFGWAVVLLWLAAIAVSGVLTPPDPLSQLLVLGPLLLVGFLIAYAAVYRMGW